MKIKSILLALLVATLHSVAHAGLPACKSIPDPVYLPGGFVYLGGSVIGNAAMDAKYGFERVCKGDSHELRFEQIQKRDQNGRPIWSTLSKLKIPNIRKDELFEYNGSCERRSVPDPTIVAIVKDTDVPFFTIVRAWRIDWPTSRFEEISTVGIVCNNDAYGADSI